MYEIHVESDEFRGKRIVQQHQLVNQVCPKYRPEIDLKSVALNACEHVTVLSRAAHSVTNSFQEKVARSHQVIQVEFAYCMHHHDYLQIKHIFWETLVLLE